MKICLPRREDVEAAHAAAEAAAADAADRTADMAAQLAAAQAAAAGAEQAAAETTALRRVWMLLKYHVCTPMHTGTTFRDARVAGNTNTASHQCLWCDCAD